MNRLARSGLGVGATLALALGGLPMASAHERLEPEVGDWVSVDETFTLPAGFACKDDVQVKEKASFRDTLYRDEDGRVVKVFSEFADWSTVKFSATTKHHRKSVTRSITLNEGGDAWVYNAQGDFDVVKVRAEGANWGQGAGIRGILWSKGDISYTVVDANDVDRARIVNLDLSDAKKVIQVCYAVGSKPVQGRNVPPPDAEPAAALQAR